MKIRNTVDGHAGATFAPFSLATSVAKGAHRSPPRGSTMRRAVSLWVVLLASLGGMSAVHAARILNGGVGFDPQANLYTYVYIVDNRFGSGAINEVNVLVDTINKFNFAPPSARTSPDGWRFKQGSSGLIEEAPFLEFGAFYSWEPICCSAAGVLPGEVLGEFSFSLPLAPTTSTANNYFLYSFGNDVVEFGHIVAPDFFGFAPVPIPASLWLFVTAATGLGIARRRPAF